MEMKKVIIRNETEQDYRAMEELHRRAFWNLSAPGCNEHYLAHILRMHKDFIPELDLVCEQDGIVIANVMYSKSWLIDEQENKKEIAHHPPEMMSDTFYALFCFNKCVFSKSAQWT